MTKILYILGSGSRHDNMELRWSLRSLEQHCLPISEVEPVVVGDVPLWFVGNSLQFSDSTNRKEKNIYSKIVAAAEAGLVDGEFQISADDHFWIKDFDLSKLPIYWRETCIPDFKEGGNNYAKILAGTRRTLLNNGYPAMNTTVHCNQWVHVNDFPAVANLWKRADDDEFAREYGIASWGVFPNIAVGSGRSPRRPLKFRHDVKLGLVSSVDFKSKIQDAFCISINDDAFDSKPVMDFLSTEFSKPSRWEVAS